MFSQTDHLESLKNDVKYSDVRYPVYRGCNENLDNESLKKCTTEKIIDFIKVSFDYEMANRVFPLEKSTRFILSLIKRGRQNKSMSKLIIRLLPLKPLKLLRDYPNLKTQDI